MNDQIGTILAVFLVAVLGLTAIVDFVRHPKALELTGRLGIPSSMVPVLGAIKVAAVLGIILGAGRIRLAELTGACLVLYFAIATMTHLRVKDGVLKALPAFIMLGASAVYLLAQIAK